MNSKAKLDKLQAQIDSEIGKFSQLEYDLVASGNQDKVGAARQRCINRVSPIHDEIIKIRKNV